jgi:glycosyltransferase involved in cell wall biosynthesis
MVTFNQQKYINEAIDSVLMQNVNFDYEIVIGEDCSTDRTRQIVLEYKTKYPSKIKLILQNKNLGLIRNFISTLNACNGKYTAILEGDDYWTDPNKLQKQVNYLENNSDYGLVHTAIKIYNQNKDKMVAGKFGNSENTFIDLLLKNEIYPLSVLFRTDLSRNYLGNYYSQSLTWKTLDYPLWLFIANKSKIKFFAETTAVYRLAESSLSRPNGIKNKIAFTNSIFDIKIFFAKEFKCDKVVWNSMLISIAEMKIKKGLLVGDYNYYKEGMIEKKKLGVKIRLKEKLYGIFLSKPGCKKILSYILTFKRFA